MFKAELAKQYITRRTGGMNAALAEKHQRSTACPMMGSAVAPFDYIGDNLRSFTECLNDIRRYPQKVAEALEVITEMLIKDLDKLPQPAPKGAKVFSALHMPTFMRTSDFEKFWWPSYLRFSQAIIAHGYTHLMFCEDDWNRYVTHLQELSPGCIICFEYMDAAAAKEKLGKEQILAGFFPLSSLGHNSPDACVDEAKRVIDIMAPGGNYMFRTDKAPILDTDIKIASYQAVARYVMENTDY